MVVNCPNQGLLFQYQIMYQYHPIIVTVHLVHEWFGMIWYAPLYYILIIPPCTTYWFNIGMVWYSCFALVPICTANHGLDYMFLDGTNFVQNVQAYYNC